MLTIDFKRGCQPDQSSRSVNDQLVQHFLSRVLNNGVWVVVNNIFCDGSLKYNEPSVNGFLEADITKPLCRDREFWMMHETICHFYWQDIDNWVSINFATNKLLGSK